MIDRRRMTQVAALSGQRAVRGMGQGMKARIAGFIPGGWSNTYRSRHRSHVGFTRFKVVIPTFNVVTAMDTDLTGSFFYQVGFEYPYTAANTGLAARVPVTFSGSTTGAYDPTNGPFGFLVSDWITLPTPYVAGDHFGLWTTVENQLGASSPNNTLPFQDWGSNYFEKYEGNLFSVTSNLAANTALTATSITKVTTNQSGAQRSFTPCMLLIDYPTGAKLVTVTGDSIGDGTGEGNNGSSTSGSFNTGSAERNAGWPNRAMDETLGLNYTNITLPGDSFANLIVANAMKYRLQLLALANPTHILDHMGTNDIAVGTGASVIASRAVTVHTAFRGAVPGAKIVSSLIPPRTTSTDNWATSANQTAIAAFGNSASNRGVCNGYIRGLTAWGCDAFVDPNLVAEFGYDGSPATETSKWVVNGVAYYFPYDGIHPNSVATAAMAASIPGAPFA